MVDDDRLALETIARFLRALRMANPLVLAHSRDEALARLDETGTIPVLALLDLHMRGGTGIDLLRDLRADPRCADILAIMLTGSAELDPVNEAYDLGVSSYLVKPVGFDALGDALRRLDLPWAFVVPGEEAS